MQIFSFVSSVNFRESSVAMGGEEDEATTGGIVGQSRFKRIEKNKPKRSDPDDFTSTVRVLAQEIK
jgi:hypothetical protein